MPLFIATWARNLIAGYALYFGFGLLWSYLWYVTKREETFPFGGMPRQKDINKHINVSSKALVWYTFFPACASWCIQRGLTQVVLTIDELGGIGPYLAIHVAYFFLVELGIYWVHRALHDVPFLRWLHHDHHVYHAREMMSPFAGLAFHPLDGIAQASPYVACIFFMPIHFWTMFAMLFATALWTATIHDAVPKQLEPMMGAGYHTIHHEQFNYNYGQYLTLMDWIFGTLLPPTEADCDPALRAQEKGQISGEDLLRLREGKAAVKGGKVVPLEGRRAVPMVSAGAGQEESKSGGETTDESEGESEGATRRRGRAGSRQARTARS